MANIEMGTKVIGVTLSKVCSVKPDGDSTESKRVTVNMKYDGLTLGDIFQKALKSDIIQWQVSARKRFDKLGTSENVNASRPGGTPQLSTMEQFKIDAKAAGVDINDKAALTAYIEKELEKA